MYIYKYKYWKQYIHIEYSKHTQRREKGIVSALMMWENKKEVEPGVTFFFRIPILCLFVSISVHPIKELLPVNGYVERLAKVLD